MAEALSQYFALPNRPGMLVLRRYSRSKVRAWLNDLSNLNERELESRLRDTLSGRFRLRIPGAGLGGTVKYLAAEPTISPEALDAYINAYPTLLSGNAEADLCPKHFGWLNDVPRLRETLSVLLDPSKEVTSRLDDVLHGSHRLRGFGHSTATTILVCWNDGRDETDGPIYCKWTGHTERTLGMFVADFRRATPGETYAAVWDLQKRMLHEFPLFCDLSDVDLFMYYADPRGLNMGGR